MYAEIPEYNLPSFEDGFGVLCHVEARREAAVFCAGTTWDVVTVATHRHDWAVMAPSLDRLFGLEPPFTPPGG